MRVGGNKLTDCQSLSVNVNESTRFEYESTGSESTGSESTGSEYESTGSESTRSDYHVDHANP